MHLIDDLTPDEHTSLLRTLLQRHPELEQEAAAIAAAILSSLDADRVADAVESEIRGRDAGELNGRAGRTRHGYVEPGDAAWELLEETIDPYAADLRRRLDCGQYGAALSMVVGIILGLYRCRRHDGTELLAWAEDFPAEAAGDALILVAAATPPGQAFALPDRLAADAPEWEGMLRQAVASAQADGKKKRGA